MTVHSRHALIVGAGSAGGIGRACVDRFRSEGYSTTVWDRAIELPISEGVDTEVVDIRDWQRLHELAEGLPPLNAVVNCAYLGTTTAVADTLQEDWDQAINVNLNGAFYLAHAVYPALVRGRGTLVHLSSILGSSAFPNRASYCVTKSALVMLSRCLAVEWGRDGVRVVTVSPGVTNTAAQVAAIESGQKDVELLLAHTPQNRLVDRSEVASVIFRLTTDEFKAVTGANLFVDAGYAALSGGFWGLDTAPVEAPGAQSDR